MTELQKLERELAYEVAIADIESLCHHPTEDEKHPGKWYDIRKVGSTWDVESIAKAVRYLDLREVLKWHPENEYLIQIPEQSES